MPAFRKEILHFFNNNKKEGIYGQYDTFLWKILSWKTRILDLLEINIKSPSRVGRLARVHTVVVILAESQARAHLI